MTQDPSGTVPISLLPDPWFVHFTERDNLRQVLARLQERGAHIQDVQVAPDRYNHSMFVTYRAPAEINPWIP